VAGAKTPLASGDTVWGLAPAGPFGEPLEAAGPAGAVEAAGPLGPGLPGVGFAAAFAACARALGFGARPHLRGATGVTTIAGVGAAGMAGPQTVSGPGAT
jgi:hypothetical protein